MTNDQASNSKKGFFYAQPSNTYDFRREHKIYL